VRAPPVPRRTPLRAGGRRGAASHLHLACHGLLEDRFPLDSGLLLSSPKPGSSAANGLLQAWEVLERVRCDADLVVLSACETALGKDEGGEGLVGITRAFEYAGARSVVSTLWRVDDAATALLMERFYAHLRSGVPGRGAPPRPV
jgi:CHAT domain-containing protein